MKTAFDLKERGHQTKKGWKRYVQTKCCLIKKLQLSTIFHKIFSLCDEHFRSYPNRPNVDMSYKHEQTQLLFL